jgi:hypothetical protein
VTWNACSHVSSWGQTPSRVRPSKVQYRPDTLKPSSALNWMRAACRFAARTVMGWVAVPSAAQLRLTFTAYVPFARTISSPACAEASADCNWATVETFFTAAMAGSGRRSRESKVIRMIGELTRLERPGGREIHPLAQAPGWHGLAPLAPMLDKPLTYMRAHIQ